jgi:hypothetical protein
MSASLPDTFFEMAQGILSRHPTVAHEWTLHTSGKRTLRLPAVSSNGFDVVIQAETYGLYPYAGDWHGAPWDSNMPKMSFAEICEDCLGFVRSLLCSDSSLQVFYSNERPYRWVLSYPLDGGQFSDRTGLLVFNYFGRRTKRTFQNQQLPPREGPSVVPAA